MFFIFSMACMDFPCLYLFLKLEVLCLQDELSVSGSGTVIVRSPRGYQSSIPFSDQSSLVCGCVVHMIKILYLQWSLYISVLVLALTWYQLYPPCSLAIHMLLLRMLLPVVLLLFVAIMMILILLERQNLDWESKKWHQVPHPKIVQWILLRLFFLLCLRSLSTVSLSGLCENFWALT